jgi:hypothetical protein
MFAALAGILWVAGLALALWVELHWAAGAWFTGVALMVFAFLGRRLVLLEEAGARS